MDVTQWLLDGDPAIRWQTLRDLRDAPDTAVQAERARVAREGWGARLLALQDEDGSWAGGTYFPAWMATVDNPQEYPQPWTAAANTLDLLRLLGVDPRDPAVRAALERVNENVRWEEGNQPFFTGETEPCINGRTVAIGCYFGFPVGDIVERLLADRLSDGGWNCFAPDNSTVTSFETTINVLDGLNGYVHTEHDTPEVDVACRAAEEYLLRRGLFRGLSSGAPVDERWLRLEFPEWWHYSTLRALEYFRASGAAPDERAAEAVTLLRERQSADGTWPLDHVDPGETHFPLETAGEPSRWITLRALRVLRWWDAAMS